MSLLENIRIGHIYSDEWLSSGLLDDTARHDKLGNHIVFKTMVRNIIKYSLKKAMIQLNTKDQKIAKMSSIYADTLGGMGECMCEFFGKCFLCGNILGAEVLFDTSSDKYHRGEDFFGYAVIAQLYWTLQVKFRSDPIFSFKRHELRTFIELIIEKNVLPQHAILMVPTAFDIKTEDVLSWKDGFRDEWSKKMNIITGDMMSHKIKQIPSARDKSGEYEFFSAFKNSLLSSKSMI